MKPALMFAYETSASLHQSRVLFIVSYQRYIGRSESGVETILARVGLAGATDECLNTLISLVGVISRTTSLKSGPSIKVAVVGT